MIVGGNVDLVFPTPIYYSILEQNDINDIHKEMNSAINSITWSTPSGWGKTHDLSTTDFTSDDIKTHNLIKFHEVLQNNLASYCEHLNFPATNYSRTSWFSKFKPGDYGRTHNHNHADISGCYYYQTSGDDGDIYFMNPSPSAESSLCYRQLTELCRHKPIVGKLLLFPGWLSHGIMSNESNNDRISFSFNIYFER